MSGGTATTRTKHKIRHLYTMMCDDDNLDRDILAVRVDLIPRFFPTHPEG